MRVTFTGYALVSVALAVAVVANAFRSHPQFYTACVYLSKSNMSIMILFNLLLLGAVIFSKFWQRVFFGRLRTIEVEVRIRSFFLHADSRVSSDELTVRFGSMRRSASGSPFQRRASP